MNESVTHRFRPLKTYTEQLEAQVDKAVYAQVDERVEIPVWFATYNHIVPSILWHPDIRWVPPRPVLVPF